MEPGREQDDRKGGQMRHCRAPRSDIAGEPHQDHREGREEHLERESRMLDASAGGEVASAEPLEFVPLVTPVRQVLVEALEVSLVAGGEGHQRRQVRRIEGRNLQVGAEDARVVPLREGVADVPMGVGAVLGPQFDGASDLQAQQWEERQQVHRVNTEKPPPPRQRSSRGAGARPGEPLTAGRPAGRSSGRRGPVVRGPVGTGADRRGRSPSIRGFDSRADAGGRLFGRVGSGYAGSARIEVRCSRSHRREGEPYLPDRSHRPSAPRLALHPTARRRCGGPRAAPDDGSAPNGVRRRRAALGPSGPRPGRFRPAAAVPFGAVEEARP